MPLVTLDRVSIAYEHLPLLDSAGLQIETASVSASSAATAPASPRCSASSAARRSPAGDALEELHAHLQPVTRLRFLIPREGGWAAPPAAITLLMNSSLDAKKWMVARSITPP
jgi:hypothetical protein